MQNQDSENARSEGSEEGGEPSRSGNLRRRLAGSKTVKVVWAGICVLALLVGLIVDGREIWNSVRGLLGQSVPVTPQPSVSVHPSTTPPTPPSSPAPSSQQRRVTGSAKIVSPVKAPLQVVGRCLRVEGAGGARDGYEIRVGVRSYNPTRHWVRRVVQPEAAQDHDWFAWALYVGAEGDYGMTFDVALFEVPIGVLQKYDQRDPVKSYSADELAADDVIIADTVTVKRSNGPDSSCP